VKQPIFDDYENAKTALRISLLESVNKRLLSDKPIGALLSGGLDSSLIVSILARTMKTALHTFSIGLMDSKDLRFAKLVSEYCGTIHHEIVITEQDYIDAIPDVIYDIESYDTTTVRASVGNWLIGKYISEHTNIKVVFNGDGSDEIGGGYRYFQRAPTDGAFDEECRRLLKDICYFDVLRSDRSISSWGLEPRTPYLDKQFVATWLSIPTKYRRTPVEKKILREAFAGNYLPFLALWRKKEAFSDGMSDKSPWSSISNESAYYKGLYMKHYPDKLVPYKWMPRWSPETTDPSARTLSNYKTDLV
jgi:asparagine synthase (glutamine-hydrolysing)